jgi:putative ABC transport system permease protein
MPLVSNIAFDPPVDVSGSGPRTLRERRVYGNVISPGWFGTVGIPLVAGRDLAYSDRVGSPLVAVVNQAFARRFLNGASPLDHTITLPEVMTRPAPTVPMRIVGMVADSVYVSLRESPQATMYLPIAQRDEPAFVRAFRSVVLNVRSTNGSPGRLAPLIAAEIEKVNPDLALTVRPLDDQVRDSLTRERVVAALAMFFGAVALLLAALGLYGVTSYAVSRRRTEIGIRMALGAAPAGVVRLVLARVSLLVGIGVIAGAGASLWASKFVASLLYGLQPRDPVTVAGAVVVLASVGIVAGLVPAWRASRIDPAQVLRES